MSLRTIGCLVEAANGSKDLCAMAANYFTNWRTYANGVNGVSVPYESFSVIVVRVSGTADVPQIIFAIIWTEFDLWEVDDYLGPDDDFYDDSCGADNTCGTHVESESHQRHLRFKVPASHLLLSNKQQKAMMEQWKLEEDVKKKEQICLAKIEDLKQQIENLQKEGA